MGWCVCVIILVSCSAVVASPGPVKSWQDLLLGRSAENCALCTAGCRPQQGQLRGVLSLATRVQELSIARAQEGINSKGNIIDILGPIQCTFIDINTFYQYMSLYMSNI